MKIPKPRKLPSGKWNIQLYLNGRYISITEADKKVCEAKAAEIKAGLTAYSKGNRTLTQAIDAFIETRSNVLSPSTIRGYRIIQRNRFPELMDRKCNTITEKMLQSSLNSALREYSEKTVKNSTAFIKTVLLAETGKELNVKLPQVVPNEHPYLTPEQIPVFISAIKDTKIEIPCLLGLMSLRASEMYALKYSDFDFDRKMITVHGSVVPDENNQMVVKKTNKNKTSRRTVPMPGRLAELVKPDAPIINISQNGLYKAINRLCEANNLPPIGIHGLRHSFVSFGYFLQMPPEIIQEIGGWANDATMKKIYKHISEQQRLTGQNYIVEQFDKIYTNI